MGQDGQGGQDGHHRHGCHGPDSPFASHSRSREVREGGREAIEETEGGPNLA